MSGFASLVLTFWAAFFPPTIQQARLALIGAALVSFILGSYHIWAKERRLFKAEKAKHERYKIVLIIDQNGSKATFKDLLVLTISFRFENTDIYPWSMKGLDFTLHKIESGKIKDFFTMITCLYKSNGIEVPKEQFEGQLIQAGRVSPAYEALVIMQILDKEFEGFDKLSYDHFVRITMEASNQPTFTRDLFFSAVDTRNSTALFVTFGREDVNSWARKIRHLN